MKSNHILSDLLNPLPLEEFYHKYYEQQPVCIKKEGKFLWNIQEFESILWSIAGIYPERLRAAVSGKVLSESRKLSKRWLFNWALEQYRNGATLILNRLEDVDPLSKHFAYELGKSLRAQISLTAFLTPAHAQGFSAHFDTEDVFIIQSEGTKEWYLGGSEIRLPTPRQGYLVAQKTKRRHNQRVSLVQGNVLYIPRGVVHWGYATDSPSLHISADINKITVGDLLQFVIEDSEELLQLNSSTGRKLLKELLATNDCLEQIDLGRVLKGVKLTNQQIMKAQQIKWRRRS